ncbi:oxidoreductase [Vitiosangium sp. GDMCC 1.1324]|uniref:oxidoreductase n=1 Tax=Vitiosangium sp. (strain GDMCC 1.1324) TaxID=2138576 RepID=UPI000D3829B9|nr:oxidoreductase [Vitiosangium sp. GDMCC 1.1324]PTL78509.1 oxidoreductase [Vitiosangium sp. GDMCC 1.1324]
MRPSTSSRSPIRTGLLGYGLSGARFHAPLLASEPAFTLSAVATSRAEEVARDWPGVRVLSQEALLADPSLELIIIATPNDTHAALAERALLAGKHVVVEKPFTLDPAEALRLAALARERGRCLTVFHNRRWDGDFLTVRQLLEQGRLGRLYSFESHFDRFRPQVKVRWKEDDVPGGGTLWDLGAHLVDQALQLFGLPESISADLGKQRQGARATDWFHLLLRYGELRVILHSGSVVHEPWPRFVLQGEAEAWSKYGLDPQEEQLGKGLRPGQEGWGVEPVEHHGRLSRGGGVPTLPGRYEEFYRQLAAAIAGEGPVPVTAESAAQVIRVLDAAVRSAGEGRRITLEHSPG